MLSQKKIGGSYRVLTVEGKSGSGLETGVERDARKTRRSRVCTTLRVLHTATYNHPVVIASFIRQARCRSIQKRLRLLKSMYLDPSFHAHQLTLSPSFIASQLQLEAEAREALPYVCTLMRLSHLRPQS